MRITSTNRIFAVLLVAVLAGCDSYECFREGCAGGEWQQCISCSQEVSTSCTVEARDDEGEEVLDECTYTHDPKDDTPRAACFAQVRASAQLWCAAQGSSGAGSGVGSSVSSGSGSSASSGSGGAGGAPTSSSSNSGSGSAGGAKVYGGPSLPAAAHLLPQGSADSYAASIPEVACWN